MIRCTNSLYGVIMGDASEERSYSRRAILFDRSGSVEAAGPALGVHLIIIKRG